MKLFVEDKIVGIFKGFSEGGLEFHADIILKYDNTFQNIPIHGQFLIVELEGENEAVLGRITSVSAQGRLTSSAGEEYGIRAVTEGRVISEDLRESYLKYKVDIRVLGIVRLNRDNLEFAPSHRRLPHVGSRVSFLSNEILQEIAGHNLKNEDGTLAAEFGNLAFGEFVFDGADEHSKSKLETWMVSRKPEVLTRFRIDQLVSRRSFVFARAGFGKSNLVKLLFSSLYKNPPILVKNKKAVPVGTIIFDPDGEYFWPDDHGRPGLCDVANLEDKIVVFTNRNNQSAFYQSFVAGSIKLDIRQLRPTDVISIALPPEKQTQQNVQKLKGLNNNLWNQLIDLIYRLGNTTPIDDLRELILGDKENERQDAEIVAIRSNMTTIVRLIHDPSSRMMDMLFDSLRNGKLCIVDISQMRGQNGLILTGIILQQIFEFNQSQFTQATPKSIPTIAVLEEAQSVLGSTGGSESPYLAWVKEGRKFGLGAVLITQQPGSISDEILSQGDNWFIFHLLSAGDLMAVKKANAHFSNDLLSSLLNEPIPGNGIFWSSSGGKPYPISVRVLSFEGMNSLQDPDYDRPAIKTYALLMKEKFDDELKKIKEEIGSNGDLAEDSERSDSQGNDQEDILKLFIEAAIRRVRENKQLISNITEGKSPWMALQVALESELPEKLENKSQVAYDIVPKFMDEVFGNGRWTTVKKERKNDPTKTTSYLEIK
jgi:DNA helicase HerA-like ATPase